MCKMFKNSILWYCTTNSFSRGMRNIEGTYTKLRTVYGNSIFVNLFLYFRGYFNNLYKSHPPISYPTHTHTLHPNPITKVWISNRISIKYKYEYYSAFPIWPNTNTIRFFKNDRIRIRILFGFSKMTEYEYEYYSVFQKWPNTNTNTSIRPQLFEYYSNTELFAHLSYQTIKNCNTLPLK